MTTEMDRIRVYIETGKQRMIAGAIEWPGWCRTGRDEKSALEALFGYRARYARVVELKGIQFQVPTAVSSFEVGERLVGNATTDFGAPAIQPVGDSQKIEPIELDRFVKILEASWMRMDELVKLAEGKELHKGPRGGGRNLEKILQHVVEADLAYLRSIGYRMKWEDERDLAMKVNRLRQAILAGLEAAVKGELPEKGPRGGILWPARFFVRRVAWHALDHAWEIEDRVIQTGFRHGNS
jgi:hypothetical protein